MDALDVRHPDTREQHAVQAFVQAVVDETYAFIWPDGAPPIDDSDWTKGWIATTVTEILAVMLTSEDWLEDLWIHKTRRGQGIGSMLLAKAESEIAQRGHGNAFLRVVEGNAAALAFYKKLGWCVQHRAPHARLPITMITLSKAVKGK